MLINVSEEHNASIFRVKMEKITRENTIQLFTNIKTSYMYYMYPIHKILA
jgi:hypothetical protein